LNMNVNILLKNQEKIINSKIILIKKF